MPFSASKSYRIQTLAVPPSFDIADLFAAYANQPWAMLLDSANSKNPNAKFDIMVADPIATITSLNNTNQIWHSDSKQAQSHSGCPISALRGLLKESFPAFTQTSTSANDLPFTIGALGYFGYDLGRVFEDFEQARQATYDTPDMAVGIYSWSVVKNVETGTVYLIDSQEHPAPTPEQLLKAIEQTFQSQHSFKLAGSWQSNMTEAQYTSKIQRIHHYLRNGDCYQVNLAQRFDAPYTGSEWSAYRHLRAANSAPFSAYLQLPNSTIASISPERFVQVRQGKVQSQPIKGTRPRVADHQLDQRMIDQLLNSDKDRAENLMIVDLLRNDLSKSSVDGSVQVPSLFAIESFEAVHHLVSTVTATLAPGRDALDLLKDAFPGGSITGAPKIRAMQIIDELEPDQRNIYCGSIGYIDVHGNMDTSICIRTLLFEQNRIYCWAGGGIVLDSDAESEYQESFDKVSKILPELASL